MKLAVIKKVGVRSRRGIGVIEKVRDVSFKQSLLEQDREAGRRGLKESFGLSRNSALLFKGPYERVWKDGVGVEIDFLVFLAEAGV